MSNEKIINANAGAVKKSVTAVIVVLVLLVLILNSFTTVNAGHSGVVTTFGEVSETVLAEGLHFKIPFIQKIILIDNRVQKSEATCTAASKDLQTVSSTIAVNYKVLNSFSANVYKNIGMDYEAVIITPAIQECVKAVTAKFTAEELITKRQSIGDQMMELLKEKISTYGIEIQIFNITSFDFTDEYNAAIEAKQTAQQNALKAQQDLQRIKVEAEQTIERAQAEAEAYRLKSEQLTPEILISNYIEKWDGKLPTVVSGDGGTMMIDISELMGNLGKNGNTSGASNYTPPVQNNVSDEENE